MVDYTNDTSTDDLETIIIMIRSILIMIQPLRIYLNQNWRSDENKNLFEDVKFVKTVYNISDDENKHDKKNLEQKKQKRLNLLKKCLLICVYDWNVKLC